MIKKTSGVTSLLGKLLIFTISFFLNHTIEAQNLTVTTGASTSGLSQNQFLIPTEHPAVSDPKIEIGENHITFLSNNSQLTDVYDFSVSPAGKFVAALVIEEKAYHVVVHEISGRLLHKFSTNVEVRDDDPSVKIYANDNGGVVVRSNIVFFDVFSPSGELVSSVTAIQGSNLRTGVADATMSNDGSVLLFYVPEIHFGSQIGSTVKRFAGNDEHISVFESTTQRVVSVGTSADGNRIVLHVMDGAENHEAVYTDVNGSVMQRISFDFNPVEVSLTSDGRYIVARGSGRVVVFDGRNGNRLGATSVRGPSTISATFLPQSQTILILTGDVQGRRITNAQVHSVNVAQRSISRNDVPTVLGHHPRIPFSYQTIRPGVYVIRGAHQNLVVRTP